MVPYLMDRDPEMFISSVISEILLTNLEEYMTVYALVRSSDCTNPFNEESYLTG